MEGWSEEEIKNSELLAPCGLYCGTCGIYIATRDGNDKFRNAMAKVFGTKPEETECLGCMQADPPAKLFCLCKTCEIRECIKKKGYYSCLQCETWPCNFTDKNDNAIGQRVMKKAIPDWRKKVEKYGDQEGSENWARSECERYHCSSCGKPLFRGAQQCRFCKNLVADELDGSL